jgi:hypothetical protein
MPGMVWSQLLYLEVEALTIDAALPRNSVAEISAQAGTISRTSEKQVN